eukprot:CAMPEP_0172544814 /NCGR_PEP_ID=MMETSP1067-20121228/14883_1 /TAXON_ID=265564 ORGANISM="Thalassiosira punctigera, Strain Tpunct2005C2" /NCGR_SAMPLE_ID=MMETSP1067 /ASSEMBLY_ACC=CAM_ASM_000444 /LENGTH=170 /DNA_ID=CAMNT_0013331437 /DNA_START=376 /DNA_END=885 /DNA_ORIENTATION=+
MKLKELYHRRSFAHLTENDQSHNLDTFPKRSPRYQCLDLSTKWIVSELNKHERALSLQSSTKEQWKTLNCITKTFLEDMVNILRERYSGSSSEAHRLTPSRIPSLNSNSTAITPPPSPPTLPVAVSEDSVLPQERCPEIRRKEINMSDDEIISLWNGAAPSVNGVDLDVW